MPHELARVLFPPVGWKWHADLFVRSHNERFLSVKGTPRRYRVYEFNTWMNLFAAKKWSVYCDIGVLYLRLAVKGSYRVEIIGCNYSHAFGVVETPLADRVVADSHGVAVELPVPRAEQYEGVYFNVFEEIGKPIDFISAAWAADKAPRVKNKLAIVSCTFKREAYINKTIELYENWLKENEELKGRFKLFVVDNGRTLDSGRSNETTEIIPNMNTGGSGGFTRGLMEALYRNEEGEDPPYTRVLFMDDDIETLPEIWRRTLALADYLREEYEGAFINGAMMNIFQKHWFYENLAVSDKFWVAPYIHERDVFILENILITNDIDSAVFQDNKASGGWWCHCFDIRMARDKGLPLPFFIRSDDIEWSWRHQGRRHIAVNGISVWHEPFAYKSAVIESYFAVRNHFFTRVIHDKTIKENLDSFFYIRFIGLLRRYDYNNIELFLRAMDDILRGGAAFRENPEEQFKALNQMAAKKIVYYEASQKELEEAKRWHVEGRCKVFLLKAVYWLTGGGKYCPDFLFRKRSMALEWFPPAENFMLCKEVNVFNLVSRKYSVRRFDRRLVMRYEKEFKKRLKKIKDGYEALKKDCEEAYKEFTGFEFWEKYLGIKRRNI